MPRDHIPRRDQFCDVPAAIAVRSHFIIERWGIGWAVTVRRIGRKPETTLAASAGELNRLRLELTDSGLVGFVAEGAA